MYSPGAIWIGIGVIVAVAAYLWRYEMAPAAANAGVVYRLDRWTGQIQLCTLKNLRVECQ